MDFDPRARRPAGATHQPSVGGTEKETRMNTHSTTLSSPVVSTRIAPAVSALLLGLFLFIGAGFAGPTILHNSTHDTRHALGLPCH